MASTGVADVALNRLERARACPFLVHADVVLAAAEIRAVEVVADKVAGLRIHRDAQTVLTSARCPHEVRDVGPTRAPGEACRASLHVGHRYGHRTPFVLQSVERTDDRMVRVRRILDRPD